jgi:hypothetical protein
MSSSISVSEPLDRPANVLVAYYSATGHVHALAKAVRQGAEDAGAEVRLRHVEELAHHWGAIVLPLGYSVLGDLAFRRGVFVRLPADVPTVGGSSSGSPPISRPSVGSSSGPCPTLVPRVGSP